MRILSISAVVPRDAYTTDELVEAFPCPLPEGVKRNVLNTGVRKRHLLSAVDSRLASENEVTHTKFIDLCKQACEEALRKADLSRADVGYLIATHDANPLLSPGLSYVLVPQLKLDVFVKHVNAQGLASAALPKALDTAYNYLAAHPDDYVLVCISGMSSFWFQNQVRGLKNILEIEQIKSLRNIAERRVELRKWIAVMQCFLFGDGVSALVLTNRPQHGLEFEKIAEVTNVEPEDYLAGYSKLLAVGEPYRFELRSHLDQAIPNLGARYTDLILTRLLGEEKERLIRKARKWALHTGSRKILKRVAQQHGIADEKLSESYQVLREYGNLAGASLPFILEKIVSGGELSAGDMVVMVGYGWGFTAAAGMLKCIR